MSCPQPNPAPRLIDGDLMLRPADDGDWRRRLELGRVPEIARMFAVQTKDAERPLTEAEARRWADRLAGNPYGWVIEHEGRFLGEIFLNDVDLADGDARLACGLYDPEKLGQGLGRRAVRLVLAYCFEQLRLHRVGLRVIAYNERAFRCYRACGFQEEGRLREAVLMDGDRYDDILMSILASEYEAQRRGSGAP